MPLLAFHNDPKIRAKYIARVKRHHAADEIIQGDGWDERTQKGCAVGCSLDDYNHKRYPIELGIPELLAYVEDDIHEALRHEDSLDWPVAFLSAIPLGADLSQVMQHFAVWRLTEGTNSKECAAVAGLYERLIAGDCPKDSEWRAAEAATFDRWRDDASTSRRTALWLAYSWAQVVPYSPPGAFGPLWLDRSFDSVRRSADMLLALLAMAPVPGDDGAAR